MTTCLVPACMDLSGLAPPMSPSETNPSPTGPPKSPKKSHQHHHPPTQNTKETTPSPNGGPVLAGVSPELVAGISPELVPCWRAFPRMGGPLLAGVPRVWGTIGPVSPNWPPECSLHGHQMPQFLIRRVCPSSPEFCPRSPEFCPRSPEFCPRSPEFCPSSPEFCPSSPEFCPSSPELPEFARIARVRPNCPSSPDFHGCKGKGVSRNRQAETNAPPLEGGLRRCETAPSNRAEDKNPVASSSKG